jgi:hypothetical protein
MLKRFECKSTWAVIAQLVEHSLNINILSLQLTGYTDDYYERGPRFNSASLQAHLFFYLGPPFITCPGKYGRYRRRRTYDIIWWVGK